MKMKKEEIKNFVPFGDEWKKEILKLKKLDIVNMLARVGMENIKINMLLDSMKKRIDELEDENEQLRYELYDSVNGNLGNIKAGKL